MLRTLGAQKKLRPDETESTIVMRGLRDMNLSKLVNIEHRTYLKYGTKVVLFILYSIMTIIESIGCLKIALTDFEMPFVRNYQNLVSL